MSSGKSLSISCWVMPDAMYSRTSPTVMRVPRMHGFTEAALRVDGDYALIGR